jgi:enoyl-CoA hydratase/carnithine racemase
VSLRALDHGAVRILTMGGAGFAADGRSPQGAAPIDGEKQMNVLSRALVEEIAQQARRAAAEAEVRAVILTGAGSRAFCAGANLKERQGWTADDIRRWLVELHAGLREIERCRRPWIAAINGLALGGGCELALACDLRVMDPAAQIALTETKIGIIPGGGGTVRLSRIVGMGRAKDMIFTARRVDAQEALQIGLANRISAAGDVVSAALALAGEIAGNAPIGISAAKASIEESWDLSLDAALEAERRHYERVLLSEDRLEGLKAFNEKRPPRWKGS